MEPIEQIHTFNEYRPKKNRFYQTQEDTNKKMMYIVVEILLVVIGQKKINGMIINIINIQKREYK